MSSKKGCILSINCSVAAGASIIKKRITPPPLSFSEKRRSMYEPGTAVVPTSEYVPSEVDDLHTSYLVAPATAPQASLIPVAVARTAVSDAGFIASLS
jgi:hypothetical protein